MPEPELLYHYTTADGLMGILKSGQLRAADRRFLNDLSEAEHGAPLLERLNSAVRSALTAELPHVADLPELLTAFSERLSDFHQEATQLPWYVASFCEEPNLLTQWIGYGHEASYSIGLTRKGLETLPVPGTWKLMKVTYDPNEQLTRLRAYAIGELKALTGATAQEQSDGIRIIVAAIILVLICYKHAAFDTEQEWRLFNIVPHTPALRVEVRSNPRLGLVPYSPVDIGSQEHSLIKEIWIGPTSLADEPAKDAVQALLAQYDVLGVEVHKSKIPYRW